MGGGERLGAMGGDAEEDAEDSVQGQARGDGGSGEYICRAGSGGGSVCGNGKGSKGGRRRVL